MLDSLSVNAGYSQALTHGYSKQAEHGKDKSAPPEAGLRGVASVAGLLKSLENDQGDVFELGSATGKNRIPSNETLLALIEEKVNKNVEKAFPEEEVENPLSDDYWSPEKTAKRIVDFALKYYDHYSEKNGGESEESLDKFLSIITGAIDQGFAEARTTIGEMNGGEVPEKNAGTITSTRDHITSLLADFRQSVMDRISGVPAETEPEAEAVNPATL